MKLTFKSDGTATRTTFGSGRSRTPDVHFTGAVPRAEIEKLEQLVRSEGFERLRDEYRDPSLADGQTVTITVTTTAGRKSVIDSNDQAPPNLRRIAAAIEGLGKTVEWKRLE